MIEHPLPALQFVDRPWGRDYLGWWICRVIMVMTCRYYVLYSLLFFTIILRFSLFGFLWVMSSSSLSFIHYGQQAVSPTPFLGCLLRESSYHFMGNYIYACSNSDGPSGRDATLCSEGYQYLPKHKYGWEKMRLVERNLGELNMWYYACFREEVVRMGWVRVLVTTKHACTGRGGARQKEARGQSLISL